MWILQANKGRAKKLLKILPKDPFFLAHIKLISEKSMEKPFRHFDFDLARAVLEQLVEVFDSLSIGSLEKNNIFEIDEKAQGVAEKSPGVYMLFVDKILHYVGKADRDLSGRLSEHLNTLISRKNVVIEKIGFKAITVHRNWTPLTHEESLIRHYKGTGLCEWNTKGIGNHDPGRNREDTKTNAFDLDYPINEEFVVLGIEARQYNARELLLAIKAAVPYVFRFETDEPKGGWKNGSEKYNSIKIDVPMAGMSMRGLLQVVVEALPDAWYVTFFPGHVILYEEKPQRVYAHAVLTLKKNHPAL